MKSTKSQKNQSHTKINFYTLVRAKPTFVVDPSNEEAFIKMSHDKAIGALNAETAKGIFPPLNILKMVIKKFQNDRFGEIVDVEELYKVILEKYKDVISSESKEAVEIHSEMMLVHLRRRPKEGGGVWEKTTEERIHEIYKQFPNIYTYNVLMEMLLSFKRYKKVVDYYQNCPKDFEKDEWSYSRYFGAVIKTAPKNAEKIYADEIPEKFKYYIEIVINMLKILDKQKGIDAAQAFFDSIPIEYRRDGEYRTLIRLYFKKTYVSEAMAIYDNWPRWIKKSQPTYLMIIQEVYPSDLSRAIAIYREALDQGLFKKNLVDIDEREIGSGLVKVKIDFHYEEPKELGTPTRGGFGENVIRVMLEDLKERVNGIKQIYPLAKVQVHLITGKGSGKQRRMVEDVLKKELNWEPIESKDNEGEIHVDLPSLSCLSSGKDTLPYQRRLFAAELPGAADATIPKKYIPPHRRNFSAAELPGAADAITPGKDTPPYQRRLFAAELPGAADATIPKKYIPPQRRNFSAAELPGPADAATQISRDNAPRL
jgi:hypothetical protein